MRAKQFTLTAIKPQANSHLTLMFADDVTLDVNLAPIIAKYPGLSRLLQPAVFATAKLREWGASVISTDDDNLELAADNLHARAIEQAGGYSHELIWNWMHRHQLTLDAAARALGLSRRMLAYYRSGEKPLPRTVALACLGWEAEQRLAS